MQMERSSKYSVKEWIEDLQKKGRITFRLSDAIEAFPLLQADTVKRSLTRLTKKRKICSAWNGFYVIVSIEYQDKGIVPVIFYIDHLMKFLGRDYYISLLNAASFYGAAHQRPQEYTIVTTPPSLRASRKEGVKINFINKSTIPEQFTERRKTQTGYVKIASAELTATDLVQYEKEIGGLNRTATVLNELAESLNFKGIRPAFFEYVPLPVIQRLGYLLDVELGFTSLADDLLSEIEKKGNFIRKVPLKYRNSTKGCTINEKWKIIINESIEIDE
ncbi:type IV toxin-antitoxin system AbiEi family antitoxin domain-containing protein [Limibacterium fermenti]|uniref:type IV toxin-antitoxin system AbiEi family antitoxin domain-containing protein n=1 Tax=Limibacterium fermenti TaxID=3229863 RepID=UPI003A658615